MIGRPPKISLEIQSDIIAALKLGNDLEASAKYAGIGKTTLYRWLRTGKRQKSGEFRRLYDSIRRVFAALDEARRKEFLEEQARNPRWRDPARY